MRKTIYTALLFASCLLTESWAQDYMQIKKRDGTTMSIPLKSIQKLTFSQLVTANPQDQVMAASVLQQFSTYPNPASGYFRLSYELQETSAVAMELYNEKGQMVNRVDKGILGRGSYQDLWATEELSNGVYICKIMTNKGIVPKKIIINK